MIKLLGNTSYTISYYPPNSPIPVDITNETGYFSVWIMGSVFALIGALVSLILRSGKGICYDDDLHTTAGKSA
ncbi:MAG: hypothetical protein H5T41_03745 [Methanomassiliicoccales archaeon]|jgi:hypothetical protein|nr:hypothetical protein [Methanomassiliicoccales archaeon]